MFDGDNIYVAARCWDRAPPDKWIANELRRDTNQMRQERSLRRRLRHLLRSPQRLHVLRQPARRLRRLLGDRRRRAEHRLESGVGRRAPAASRAAGRWRWRFPFKSLRYTSGPDQVWGIQFRRSIRHKNEWTYWTPVPQNMAGPQALNRVSSYGTVVGLDLPPAGRNLELKPYALGKMTTDRIANPPTAQRQRRRRRRRREVRRHREPDRRPHREHRLRAGRDRRAAGQPDALQPVPAREARVLPRGPRPVRLRPRRRRRGGGGSRRRRRQRRHAVPVLQPAHRPQSQPRRPDRRRRPPDRQGRRAAASAC